MAKIKTFSAEAMRRIGRAVAAHEGGNRSIAGPALPVSEISETSPVLCKTTSAWDKGTLADVYVYRGVPLSEAVTTEKIVGACNKFADIAADRWVWLTRREDLYWYVTAAECS